MSQGPDMEDLTNPPTTRSASGYTMPEDDELARAESEGMIASRPPTEPPTRGQRIQLRLGLVRARAAALLLGRK